MVAGLNSKVFAMSKFFITTLGCKVNQFEAEAIGLALCNAGWEKSLKGKDTDICIINTCTVTGKASMQSRQAIRNIIKNNPGAKIIVTGCYAQTEADEIKKIDGVHNIISHAEKHKIPEMILAAADRFFPKISKDCNTSCAETKFNHIDVNVHGNRTRPFLKVQDGCDAFCTYCIVPHTRGRSRSMEPDEVLHRLKMLGDSGYKEVVLTGIHIGCWGADLKTKTNFFELLTQIDKEKPVKRIRLSSIEPREVTDDMIRLFAESDTFCRHFHIPLQSGDDDILKKMHRPYTGKLFSDVVKKIHKHMPDAAIGADILVGFPGESDSAFKNTYSLIEMLPMTYLHVFPFSPRTKTPAATYPDQIKPDIIKERTATMRCLGSEKRHLFSKSLYGKTTEVLIEQKRDRKTGLLKGISSNYATILAKGSDSLMNSLVKIKINHTEIDHISGTIEKNRP